MGYEEKANAEKRKLPLCGIQVILSPEGAVGVSIMESDELQRKATESDVRFMLNEAAEIIRAHQMAQIFHRQIVAAQAAEMRAAQDAELARIVSSDGKTLN